MQLMFADIWQSLPPIIKEAASSPLGIFALMIIALAILAFFFFKESGTKVKVIIFVLLFLGVVVFAAKVVYKAREVAAQETATSRQLASERTPIPLPDDTGWIFAGYFDKVTDHFVEGPYVESIGTTTRGLRKYVQIGDTVRLKVSRPVIIVGYKTTQTSRKFESPTVAGVISSDDQTGVTLPKGTELVVRDVSEGHAPDNPNAALWLRIVYAPR